MVFSRQKSPATIRQAVLAHVFYLPYSWVNYLPFRIGTRFELVSGHTRVSKILEMFEDDIDFWPRLHFLVPTPFGNLPDRRSYSWGIEVGRF
jgi:hypothetical protein